MSAGAPVTYSVDGDGVGCIVFTDPAVRANVFDAATQAALASAIAATEAARPRAIVVMSGLERMFIAGADLAWLAALPDAATASEFSRRGHRLFQRLADSAVPVVCAMHGACVGGGFELALACDWRMASHAPSTRIGLPETGIGTIPGWGGCARLSRLIGARAALDHILNAQLLGAGEARSAGLVDEVVPVAELEQRARAVALAMAGSGRPRRSAVPPTDAVVGFGKLRQTATAKTRGRLPAPLAAIAVVEAGMQQSLAHALEIEARVFGEVTAGATCKNLIRAFQLREAARKRSLQDWYPEAVVAAMDRPLPPVRRVGVVGAGVMGSGIAHWLALHGLAVVLREVDVPSLERGLTVIRGLLDGDVKRGRIEAGEANSVRQRIATTTEWEGFGACDLVIEAIVEDIAAKRRLFAELAGIVRPDAVIASNTSALPIEEILAEIPTLPERTLGIHFFNPVAKMPLVELVLAGSTSATTAARALALVKSLGKSPILCRSSPGFLVTRVLFFYLNAAVRLWEQGVTTLEIDAALRDFGWPMGPLRLIDEVGVDVTVFIFGEMARYFPNRFTCSTVCGRMLAAGLKGRKNGASRGFYRYEGGKEIANDGETYPRAHARSHEGVGGCERERVEIVGRLMRVMVGEAERCLAEGVVKSADDVDFALLSGAGFPADRGGLLHWARMSGLLRRE